ncbi:MarR family transcriptional regulator [Streptomyces beijiangensis]|uniref:MarR family transcriptional regulator n=1 Tax=Streptomyces beijiangensis TaxID=163361 RepID=A0A939F7X2_9ACTN|nr:MarR family transcriptional regulator [Streptomyces beijiangensis]MBO0513568.1 MarR family transcriptional regulator [Streptomyces beijiangensis]
MTTAPTTVNGQVIGQAHYATRALLEGLLVQSGATFHQTLGLNYVATRGGSADIGAIVDALVGGVKIEAELARTVVDELIAAKLLEAAPGDLVRFTDAGAELHANTRAAGAELTVRLYGDIPAADLETAGRVLALVTERANSELAAS